MSNNIVSFLGSLETVAEFFKEQQKEEEEFSQCWERERLCVKEEWHHVHTEDDSIITQMRGY